MTEERMYTTKEVAKILSISDYRPKEGIKRGILVPTDINENVGRHGQYLFSADAIRRYASVLKIKPNFCIVGEDREDEINEDGSITLTPENFERVVHGISDKPRNEICSQRDVWNLFKDKYGFTMTTFARITNKQRQSMINYISRDTPIKLNELVDFCTVANIEIKIGEYTINAKKWYADDPEKYERLSGFIAQKEEAYKEYEAAKARIAELEKELGIK